MASPQLSPASAPRRRGPIDHLAAAAPRIGGGALVVRDRSLCGKWVLRGNVADRRFFATAESALGIPLPREPNTTSASAHGYTVLWLGPSEWLCVSADEQREQLAARLAGADLRATDVGDGRARFALSGRRVLDLLRKGTPLDVGPRSFPAGRCASTLLARIDVLIHHGVDGGDYDIYCDRGFAEFLFLWLVDAAAEFGPRTAQSTRPISAAERGQSTRNSAQAAIAAGAAARGTGR